MPNPQVALHVRQVPEEVVTADALVDLGVAGHGFLRHGVVDVVRPLVVARVVDLHVGLRVRREVTEVADEAFHDVVGLHVPFQVAPLNSLVRTSKKANQ